jgi:dGTPase
MTDFWLKRRSAWGQQQDDARDEFDVGYARVVHSGSFRRLQGKTQILNLGDSDFYRTRLTHSLELALCVPKIRFGIDAASGRRKLAS